MLFKWNGCAHFEMTSELLLVPLCLWSNHPGVVVLQPESLTMSEANQPNWHAQPIRRREGTGLSKKNKKKKSSGIHNDVWITDLFMSTKPTSSHTFPQPPPFSNTPIHTHTHAHTHYLTYDSPSFGGPLVIPRANLALMCWVTFGLASSQQLRHSSYPADT